MAIKTISAPQLPEGQEIVIAWQDGPGTIFVAKDKRADQVYLYMIEANSGHAEMIEQFDRIEIQKSN